MNTVAGNMKDISLITEEFQKKACTYKKGNLFSPFTIPKEHGSS
jgi:hypothetical protein